MNKDDYDKFSTDPIWAFQNCNFKSVHVSLKFVDGEDVAAKYIFGFSEDSAWEMEVGDFDAKAEWSKPILMCEYDPVTGLKTYNNPKLGCHEDIIAEVLKVA